MAQVKCRVHVRQKRVSDVHSRFARFDYGGPDIWFLRDRIDLVVVAVEGEESGELHPPVTELFRSVVRKPTRINTEHGYAVQSKREGLWDGEV